MARSPLSATRFRTIFSIGWLIVITDLAIVLKWYGWPWKVAIIDSLISSFFLLVFCLLMINTLRFYVPRRENYLNIFIWCLFLTGVWLVLSRSILIISLNGYEDYTSFLNRSLIVRGSIGLLLLGCITLVTVIWLNSEEQKENEKRKQDADKLAKDAELFKLRQQLQPHFLFNSLNSINALIGTRPGEARKMVQQLSDFLRGTIKKEDHQLVTLQEELQYLQLYLDIEKVRFGNRLSTNIETDDAVLQKKLPALLLQPVVENAIKFGLYDTTGETLISISAGINDNMLILKVQNPFDPETSSSNKGTGFGLKSVQRRLYLLFGRNDLLSTETKENIFTTVMKIPQHV
jgi:sensor histidine kinase YesM